jgi:hypothetical protein
MIDSNQPTLEPILEPGEQIRAMTRANDAIMAVTDRRLLVAAGDRIALATPLTEIRRIQFDIERSRPATLVIVPEQARDEPQVLAIAPDEYHTAAEALVTLGLALSEPHEAPPA